MAKRRQHFVPKFYLRAFQSAPNRIHLYHLNSCKAIKNASLRDQCYVHKFYGPSDKVENRLAELEDMAAPVIRAICESGEPPQLGTDQHEILLEFVGLQILRTPVARQRIKEMVTKVNDQIFGDHDPLTGSGLTRFSPLTEHEALGLQLNSAQEYVDAMSDLELHVARVGGRARLFTSDNPVFRYNSYCRGVHNYGVLGADSRGFQIFLPLSPRILLLLYDGTVYEVGDAASGRTSYLRREDVERFNATQILSAEECAYFSDWSEVGSVRRSVSNHLPHKQVGMIRVEQSPQVGNSATIHHWEDQSKLRFTLPLSRLRWRASKVPVEERATFTRRGWTWKYAT